ncbi:MAG: CAP domain-containing protein [Acidobacteriota bacterium]
MPPAGRRLAAAAAAGLFGLALLTPPAAAAAPPGRPQARINEAPGASPRPGQMQQRLFDLINGDRARAGLDALTLDAELGAIALRHSEDMRDNDFVGHLSPRKGGSEERLRAAGVKALLAAENVAKGYSPDEIHRDMMNSPGHRGAILHPEATHVGIGVASKKEGDREAYFVTELFIRRIPALGPEAKTLLLLDLNGLRREAGLAALEEDAALTGMALGTALEFLKDPGLSRSGVMDGLRRRLEKTRPKIRSAAATFLAVGSLEEAVKELGPDTKRARARRVGIGIAQGTRPDLVTNAIILVLIFVE